MEKKVIFIHGMFRSSSTYFWNKFRTMAHCYYEPFHPDLARLTEDLIGGAKTNYKQTLASKQRNTNGNVNRRFRQINTGVWFRK